MEKIGAQLPSRVAYCVNRSIIISPGGDIFPCHRAKSGGGSAMIPMASQ